jgi:hypothetical protein
MKELVLFFGKEAVEFFFLNFHRLAACGQLLLLALDHPLAFDEFFVAVVESAFAFVEVSFALVQTVSRVVERGFHLLAFLQQFFPSLQFFVAFERFCVPLCLFENLISILVRGTSSNSFEEETGDTNNQTDPGADYDILHELRPYIDPVDAAALTAGQGPNQPGREFRQRRRERAIVVTMESGTESSTDSPRKNQRHTGDDQAGRSRIRKRS